MDAVVTKKARNKMLKARAGDQALPKIVGMAFGDGGIEESGGIITPSIEQTALNNELLRKEVSGHEYLSDTVCRYSCTLEANELAGKSISEIALYDEEGDLIAIKNFSAKGKDDDLEMTFNIDDTF
jgi:phage-related tail fiber protein